MSSFSTCSGIRRISLPFYCVLSQGCNPCINSYYSDTIAVNLLMPAWMRVYPSVLTCNTFKETDNESDLSLVTNSLYTTMLTRGDITSVSTKVPEAFTVSLSLL